MPSHHSASMPPVHSAPPARRRRPRSARARRRAAPRQRSGLGGEAEARPVVEPFFFNNASTCSDQHPGRTTFVPRRSAGLGAMFRVKSDRTGERYGFVRPC
ncbi:unnamed protein product [Durusdinium trenchii]|uniref:Uncharacterized protein n=1 Tax=Durusdinium trenchii TaxID=1381693 RepID=A0ABP0SGW8_9DINO